MQINELMNRNITTVRMGTTLEQASEILSHSLASDLVVLDEGDCFVGVLSEGDLLRAVMPRFEEIMADDGALLQAFRVLVEHGHEYAHKTIDAFVIRDPLTVGPQDEVIRAASTMVAKNIRRLPVVDEGRVVGTVSRADLCAAVLKP